MRFLGSIGHALAMFAVLGGAFLIGFALDAWDHPWEFLVKYREVSIPIVAYAAYRWSRS